MQHRPFGEGSIMVWGGITERGRTVLGVVAGHLTGYATKVRLNCRAICYYVYPNSRQPRHIPAGQRWTTCRTCFTSLSDTAEC
jgi:hypothetical protein